MDKIGCAVPGKCQENARPTNPLCPGACVRFPALSAALLSLRSGYPPSLIVILPRPLSPRRPRPIRCHLGSVPTTRPVTPTRPPRLNAPPASHGVPPQHTHPTRLIRPPTPATRRPPPEPGRRPPTPRPPRTPPWAPAPHNRQHPRQHLAACRPAGGPIIPRHLRPCPLPRDATNECYRTPATTFAQRLPTLRSRLDPLSVHTTRPRSGQKRSLPLDRSNMKIILKRLPLISDPACVITQTGLTPRHAPRYPTTPASFAISLTAMFPIPFRSPNRIHCAVVLDSSAPPARPNRLPRVHTPRATASHFSCPTQSQMSPSTLHRGSGSTRQVLQRSVNLIDIPGLPVLRILHPHPPPGGTRCTAGRDQPPLHLLTSSSGQTTCLGRRPGPRVSKARP